MRRERELIALMGKQTGSISPQGYLPVHAICIRWTDATEPQADASSITAWRNRCGKSGKAERTRVQLGIADPSDGSR